MTRTETVTVERTVTQTEQKTVTAKAPKQPSAPTGNKSNSPTADLPLQDGDWRLDSMKLQDDGLGDFGGSARVTYTGSNAAGGTNIFIVTVFVDGDQVAAMQGSADGVQPGDAVTVQLISQDDFVAGPYTFDFQNQF